MSYALKSTGIPATYSIKACLIVDSDGTTIVDLVGNAITRDGAVTTTAGGSWNSNTRAYFSTFGSGFNPQSIIWNTPLSINLSTGFSIYAAIHSINSEAQNGVGLLSQSSNGDRVNAIPTGGGYGISHEFASTEIYVASSGLSTGQKMSVVTRGVRSGAQSTRQGNHGSALTSAGSGSDAGFMPATWSPDIICGMTSVGWLAADFYGLLVIEGTLSDADADLLHTDWFAELVTSAGGPFPLPDRGLLKDSMNSLLRM